MTTPELPRGVAIVTVWWTAAQLRARLRFGAPDADATTVVTVVGRDAVVDHVKRWLEDLAADRPPP